MRKRNVRIVIDSRGSWCPPTPLTDLFKAWRKASMGDLIELHATEPGVESDVRVWTEKSGNVLEEVSHEQGYTKLVVRIAKRGKERAEDAPMRANMSTPDFVSRAPKAKIELVNLRELALARRTLEPGWRWSESMKPIAKTESCQDRHIGYVVSGRLGFLMRDGTRMVVGPGDALDVRPGHDAWTIGDEPAVFVDMIGAAADSDDRREPVTRS